MKKEYSTPNTKVVYPRNVEYIISTSELSKGTDCTDAKDFSEAGSVVDDDNFWSTK